MNKVDRYLKAGTRENTRRSYRAAVEHFEVTWGGFLPATGDSILRYLAEYADDVGGLVPGVPFATLRERGRITQRAREAGDVADFSRRIRQGVPGIAEEHVP